MIKLDIKDYCQDCRMFKPLFNEKVHYDKEAYIEFVISCEHKDFCQGIEKHIAEHLSK